MIAVLPSGTLLISLVPIAGVRLMTETDANNSMPAALQIKKSNK